MAEIVVNALKQSSLYASSIQGQGPDSSEYVYDLPRSTINYFKDRHVRVKINQTDPNSTFSVEIPAFGILRGMTLHTTFTWKQAPASGGTNDELGDIINVSRDLYANICKRFSLMNSSREIQNLPSDVLKLRVKQLPADERARWELAGYANVALGSIKSMTSVGAGSLNAAATGGYVGEFEAVQRNTSLTNPTYQIDVYTPLLFSCFEKGLAGSAAKNCFNTRFLERLSLQGEINGIHEMLVASTTNGLAASGVAPAINAMELLCDFDIVETRDLDKIEQANYSLDTPLSIIQGNIASTEKAYTATAGENEVTMSLFNTQLAHSLIVTLVPKRTSTRSVAIADAIGAGTSVSYQGHGTSAGFTNAEMQDVLNKIHRNQQHTIKTSGSAGVGDNSRVGADYKKIKYLKLEVAGRVIYEAKTYQELLFLTADSNHFRQEVGGAKSIADMNDESGNNASNIYILPFAENEKMLNHLSGNLAMKGLNSCQLTIKFDNPSAAAVDYTFAAHVCYQQALSVESNSGRIAISVST